MYCQQCGANLPDNAKFCTECGARTNLTPQQEIPRFHEQPTVQATPKTGSSVKPKKPIYKRVWFWVVIGLLFLRVVIPSGTSSEKKSRDSSSQSNYSQQSSNGTEKNTTQPTSKPVPTKTPILEDGIIDVDISKCHVQYLSHEIVTNMAGNTCLAVYYQFTNNDKEAKSFVYTIGNKAFQDGIELESSLFHVNDSSHDADAEIRPGVSITVCRAYELRNNESDVELEVAPWISFRDTPDDKMIISLH